MNSLERSRLVSGTVDCDFILLSCILTPIEGEDINTPAVFGEYIDIYDVSRAIEDGATVPIYYTSRLVKLDITGEGKKLIEEFDGEMDRKEEEEEENPDIIRKRNAGLALLVGNKERRELIT